MKVVFWVSIGLPNASGWVFEKKYQDFKLSTRRNPTLSFLFSKKVLRDFRFDFLLNASRICFQFHVSQIEFSRHGPLQELSLCAHRRFVGRKLG